jgi:hypothetical protein
VPSDRLTVLRRALDDTLRDPRLLADARKRRLGVDPLPGADLGAMMADVAAQPKAVVDRMTWATAPMR